MRRMPAPFAPNLTAALIVTCTLALATACTRDAAAPPSDFATTFDTIGGFIHATSTGNLAPGAPRPGGLDRTEDPDRHGLAGRVRRGEQRGAGAGSTPRGLWVFEICADYLLGVQRDELDVPFVVMVPLERDE